MAWPGLPEAVQQTCLEDAVALLKSLHAWRPSDAASAMIASIARPRENDAGIAGASILPLPLDRALALLAAAAEADPSNAAGFARERLFLSGRAGLVSGFDSPGSPVVHGDFTASNLWFDGGRVVGLLDFEWCRFAPACVELDRIDEAAAEEGAAGQPAGFHMRLRRRLEADYPQLFDVEDLAERLQVLQTAHQIRERQLARWSRATGIH